MSEGGSYCRLKLSSYASDPIQVMADPFQQGEDTVNVDNHVSLCRRRLVDNTSCSRPKNPNYVKKQPLTNTFDLNL